MYEYERLIRKFLKTFKQEAVEMLGCRPFFMLYGFWLCLPDFPGGDWGALFCATVLALVGDHLDRRWRNQEATTQIAEVSVGMASPNDFPAFEPGSRYLYLDPKTGEIFDLSVGEED